MRQTSTTLTNPSQATYPFGLPEQAITGLCAVFARHPRIEQAILFGSRAKGTYRHNSDIDLMLTAPKLPWAEFNRVEQAIDDLLLPWKVDLVLKHQIENPDLLNHIARVGIEIYPNTLGNQQ